MASSILLQGFDAPSVNLPQQQAAQAPQQSGSLLGKIGNFVKSSAASFVHPLTDIANGVATDIAASSGNKSVRDYAIQQQKGFTFKRAAGDEIGLASMLLPGAKGLKLLSKPATKFLPQTGSKVISKLGPNLIPRIVTNAAAGGGFNASSAMANNQSNGDILKAAGIGALTGGVLTGAGSLVGRIAHRPPQVVTHTGATTLTPPPVPIVHAADLPKPSIAETKFNPLGTASDADLMVRNHVANMQAMQGEGAQLPNAAPLSAEAKAAYIDRVNGHAGASPPPTAAPANPSLPAGFSTSSDGRIIAPSGQEANLAQIQQATQEPYLTAYENAAKSGDTNAMSQIAQAHPDDARVNIKGVAKSVLTPNSPPDLSQTSAPVAPVAAAARKSNLLQRIGGGLKKPATGATAPASPFGATKEANINSFLKKEGLIKPGSNSQSIYEALPGKFKEYQTQAEAMLAKDTSTVDPAGLAAKVEQAIGANNHFLGSDAAAETVKTNVKNAIQKFSTQKDGHLTAHDLYKLKGQMQDELTKAYAKIDKGVAPSGGEDALLAARNAINDLLPKDIKAVGQKQSMLFDASVGLNKARNEKARVPKLTSFVMPHKSSKALAHGMQSVGTAIGSPIEAAGNLAAKAGDLAAPLAGKASDVLNNPLTSMAAAPGVSNYLDQQPAPQDPTQQPTQDPTGMTQPQTSQFTPGASLQVNPATGQLEELPQDAQADDGMGGITSQDIENAMIQDLAVNGGANLSHLNTIYSIVQKREAQAAAAQKQQRVPQASANSMQDAQTAIQGLQDIQAAFNKTKDTGKGFLSKIIGRTPLVGNDVAAVNNAIRVALPSIAKSLGYGTTSADLKALLTQLPTTSDTQKSAQVKLSLFQQKIEQQLQQSLAIQEAYQPDNTSSSLSMGAPSPDLMGAM